jgi:glycosyl transferase, family 25
MPRTDLQTYLINLDRSPERLATMSGRLDTLGLSWQRVPAVDGRALPDGPLPEVDVAGYARRHGKALNRAEVGCYHSHLQALRTFLDGDAAFALILEDDAVPAADLPEVVAALIVRPQDWDVVKLSGFHSGTPLRSTPLFGRYRLGLPFSRHCNTAALLFNRPAAEAVWRKLKPMSLPYDHALERPWHYGKRLHIMSPSPCRVSDGSASTIAASAQTRYVWYRRLSTYGFRLGNELRRLGWATREALRM